MNSDDIASAISSKQGQSYLPLPQKVIAADVAGPDLSKEAIWLLAGLLLCALMIIGCACCSLRLTKLQQRRRIELDEEAASHGLRPKISDRGGSVNGGVSGGGSFAASIGQEISCEFENSVDQTSTSAK